MRIDGLVIAACLGLGLGDLLTINLVLSPRLAGEPVGPPAALALAVRPDLPDTRTDRLAPAPVAVAPTVVVAAVAVPAPSAVEPDSPPSRTVADTGSTSPASSPLAVVYFDKSLARLDGAARSKLDGLAAELRRHPQWRIQVSGHTDPTGPADWNRRLSVRRARVVAARLERAGVDAARIETEGRAALEAQGPAERCRRAQVALRGGDE